MDKVSERVRQHFLFSVSDDQCNSLLNKPILARTLNSRGIEFANISENYVLANISESTVTSKIKKAEHTYIELNPLYTTVV